MVGCPSSITPNNFFICSTGCGGNFLLKRVLHAYIPSIPVATVPANSAVVTAVITHNSGHPIDQRTKTSVEIR